MNNDTNQPATPPTDTPAAAQPAAPAPQPQVITQYVVSEQSLAGIGGWLVFWMILFSIAGIAYISAFFAAITAGSYGATTVLTTIFAPLLAIGFIGAVVYLAMQKKLGRLITLATLGLSALYAAINIIVAATTVSRPHYDSFSYSAQPEPTVQIAPIIAGVLITLVMHGLIGLYFILSKRVNQTLTK